jgi:hypothetical protein
MVMASSVATEWKTKLPLLMLWNITQNFLETKALSPSDAESVGF